MDIKDITKRTVETLGRTESGLLENYNREHEKLSSLVEVIWTLEESLFRWGT